MLVVAVCEFAALEAADGTPISPMTAIGVMVVVTAVTSVTVAGPTFIYTINAGLLQSTYNHPTLSSEGSLLISNITHEHT